MLYIQFQETLLKTDVISDRTPFRSRSHGGNLFPFFFFFFCRSHGEKFISIFLLLFLPFFILLLATFRNMIHFLDFIYLFQVNYFMSLLEVMERIRRGLSNMLCPAGGIYKFIYTGCLQISETGIFCAGDHKYGRKKQNNVRNLNIMLIF